MDGIPLSLTTLIEVRDRLGQNHPVESAFDFAINAALLARESERRGSPMKPGEALDLVMSTQRVGDSMPPLPKWVPAAGGKEALLAEISRLRSSSKIEKNDRVLEKIR